MNDQEYLNQFHQTGAAPMANDQQDPIESYDAQHGKRQPDSIPSPEQAWATGQNPVQDTPLPAKNLRSVGR
jgi:hypothetical protein